MADISVFEGGKSCRRRRRTVARLGTGAAVKFHFNISDIFAALMINFFVCRVGSPSFCHGYQPPPAAFPRNKIIKNIQYFLDVRTAGNIRKLLCWSALSKKKERKKGKKRAARRRIDIFSQMEAG